MEKAALQQKLDNLQRSHDTIVKQIQTMQGDAIAYSGAIHFCQALIAEMEAAEKATPPVAPSQPSNVITIPSATVTTPASVTEVTTVEPVTTS